jgi:hypothetical protein
MIRNIAQIPLKHTLSLRQRLRSAERWTSVCPWSKVPEGQGWYIENNADKPIEGGDTALWRKGAFEVLRMAGTRVPAHESTSLAACYCAALVPELGPKVTSPFWGGRAPAHHANLVTCHVLG